ncbi:hypothetical protein [Amycolatopsis eburnea]|uniref:hypothetical protein n=1 Tax=Amycolatopsis eburnea TaxID=2267691 RepID=UPI0013158AFA|nr:hypothetical protein [Amycolatopsis eburnea]
MSPTRRALRTGVAAAAAAITMTATVVAPAAAATWPNDTFDLCATNCGVGGTWGGVVWGNRTAELQGTMYDSGGVGTTVYFEAYAGSVKIDGTTRSTPADSASPFHFTIGDPDLVGGFDRLKIQVCQTNSGPYWCSRPVNADRDGVAEHLSSN